MTGYDGRSWSPAGNFHERAPEMFSYKNGYDRQINMYSLGLVLYYLAVGRYPFEENLE